MYRSLMWRKTVFLLLWCWTAAAYAQPASYPFTRLTTSQGLSNNQVNCILKDSRGFLWIGTASGLNRYDGYSFRVFRHSLRDSTSIPNNYIARLFEGPSGRIWMETRQGNVVYDPATERFYHHARPFVAEMGLPATTVVNLIKDRLGNYWVHTAAGLYYYQTKARRSDPVRHRPADLNTPIDDDIVALNLDNRGQLWLVHHTGTLEKIDSATHRVTTRIDALQTLNRNEPHEYRLFIDADNDLWLRLSDDAKGVFFVDTKTNALTHIQKGRGPATLNKNLVRSIIQDNRGLIWIGTDHGGINLLNKKTFTIRYVLNSPTDETSVAQNSIFSFYKDTDGTMWVGTAKQGLCYYHEASTQFTVYRHQPGNPSSVNYDDVNRFVEDAKGNLWLGTNGGGLTYFDRASNRFYPSALFDKAADINSVIVSLLIDHEQTLWVGTYTGGLYAIAGNTVTTYRHDAADSGSIASNNIWELFEDRQHQLWIGTLGGGLDRFDRRQKRFYHYDYKDGQKIHSNFIAALLEDRHGNLWIGTAAGIDVLDRATGRIQQYVNYTNDPNGLSNNNIIALLEDSQGTMWVGTQEGLNWFDKKTGRFHVLRQENGLPDNTILTIVEDIHHTLWIGTPNGLSHLTIRHSPSGKDTYVFRNYNESDGLPGRALNENAAGQTRRGELVFGGPNGFVVFHPNTLQEATQRPRIVLTDFQIFNKSIRAGEEIEGSVPLTEAITANHALTLTHRQNVFSIEFAALNFVHPEKIQYQYKLEGFNDNWLTADNRVRKATFTNLNPGQYVFRVRASSNNEQWSEDGVRLPITVLPPFWKSPLAYILYALLIAGLLLLARRMLLERARLTFQIEQDRQRAQHLHEIDEMKIKFFTNVSHEFRTPLTLIISPIEQLMRQAGESANGRQFQLIYRNARRLLNLVNQLLDFRKMEVQGLTLQPTRQDLVAFCREVFYSFSDLSERKHIGFTFDANVAELIMVFDQDKLERILFNLLSNAFKFTPENGQVAVRITQLEPDPASDTRAARWMTIAVTDTGIGIAPAQQEKIFERFFQSELPDSLINQGSGIGLSITKEFVQLHGGTLTVESEPDRGSTFTIRLPIRDETYRTPAYEPVQESVVPMPLPVPAGNAPKNGNRKPALLLVEDNEDFRFYLKDNLGRQYTILEAGNGRDGWQLVQAHLPDLVVSDVMMPEMDGIELCSRIKADRRTAHIPVLLLTARSAEEQKLEGFETGASDYITKPFNFEILHARIKNLISQQNLLQKALKKPVDLTPGAVEIISLDDKLIQKALAIVEKNIDNPDFSVEEMSHELGMSRVHLYKKLLALTNKSPIEFIRTVRLLRAAQLLGKSQLTVAEIAYQVGFNNPKYFAKYFKQEFGVIPSQYAAGKGSDVTTAGVGDTGSAEGTYTGVFTPGYLQSTPLGLGVGQAAPPTDTTPEGLTVDNRG